MIARNATCIFGVLVFTLLGCGKSDPSADISRVSTVPANSTPPPSSRMDAVPTDGATDEAVSRAPVPEADRRAADVPSWVGASASEPFDVEQYLESRAAPIDNAAPLYLAALEQSGRLTELSSLANVELLRSGSISPQQVERALAAVGPVLEQIDHAQAKPSCVFVTEFGLSTPLLHVQAARQIARASLLQLYLARAQGDPDRVAMALTRALRLSRDLRPRGSLMSQLVSMAIDQIVLDGITHITLNDPELTADQCDQVLAILVEHEQQGIDRDAEGLRMDYIHSRQTIEDIRSGRLQPAEIGALLNQPSLELPLQQVNYAAETAACQRLFATALQETQTPYHQAAETRAYATEFQRMAAQARARQPDAPMLALLFAPAVDAIREGTTRAAAQSAGVQLLIAIRRYEVAQGTLPGTLEEAVSGTVLPAVPMDPFSGQPMRYFVEGDSPTVYSTGRDLKDDGGRKDWNQGRQPGDYLFPMTRLRRSSDRADDAEIKGEFTPAIRVWTSTAGTTAEAAFAGLAEQGDVVLLKRRDGKTIRVPVSKLSQQDLEWIRQFDQ